MVQGLAIRLFNLSVDISNFCERLFRRIGVWRGVRYRRAKLVHPWVMDKNSHQTLRRAHDLLNELGPTPTLSGNSGLHNTLCHKIKVLYCIAAIEGTGEIPNIDQDDCAADWAYRAWELHSNGQCDEDGCFPEDEDDEDKHGWTSTSCGFCPFCYRQKD